MKKFMKAVWILAASALAFSSCVEEQTLAPQDEQAEMVTIQINAGSAQTKTHLDPTIDGPTTQIKWNESEKLEVIENTLSNHATAEGMSTDGGLTANFTVKFNKDNSSQEFNYWGIYPSTSFVKNQNTNVESLKLSVPFEQLSQATTFDPDADLLISRKVSNTIQAEEMSFQFKRLVSIVELTLKGVPETEVISEVKFITSSSPISGELTYNLNTEQVTAIDANANMSITVYPLDSKDKVFFTMFPTTLTNFQVVANTESGKQYSKTVTGINLEAEANNIYKLNVGLNEHSVVNEFVPLTRAAKDGDEILICDVSQTYFMGAQDTDFRTAVNMNKKIDKLTETDVEKAGIHKFYLAQVDDLKPGSFEICDFNYAEPLLACMYPNSSTSLTTVGYDVYDKKISWDIDAQSDGSATITNNNTENTNQILKFSKKSKKFAVYGNAGTAIRIFVKQEGIATTPKVQLMTPVLKNSISTENSITLEWEPVVGASNYTISWGTETFTTAETQYTLNSLHAETEYIISITANPQNVDLYEASDKLTCTVKTAVAPTINVTKSKYDVDAKGYSQLSIPYTILNGEGTVEVTKNADWVEIIETNPDRILVKVLPNISTSQREGKLTIKLKGTSATNTVNIIQAGIMMPEITILYDGKEYDAATKRFSIGKEGAQINDVKINVANSIPEIQLRHEWTKGDMITSCTLVDNILSFTVAANNGIARESSITLRYGEDAKPVTIAILQEGSQIQTSGSFTLTPTALKPDGLPSGATASFNNTYNNKEQITKGNQMTYTISGMEGRTITGITLNMKSNSKKGAGSLELKAGNENLATISPSKFNQPNWHNNWSTTYVPIKPTMTNPNYVIKATENVVLTISASENSLYCNSVTIEYR